MNIWSWRWGSSLEQRQAGTGDRCSVALGTGGEQSSWKHPKGIHPIAVAQQPGLGQHSALRGNVPSRRALVELALPTGKSAAQVRFRSQDVNQLEGSGVPFSFLFFNRNFALGVR